MRLRVVFVALVAGSCAAPQPEPSRGAGELAGRIAGPPERCVLIEPSEALRVSETDPHTLIYGSGRILWANRPGNECGFHADDVLVTEPIGSSYCRGDLVRSFDRFSRIPGPACVLGDFVPFRRG